MLSFNIKLSDVEQCWLDGFKAFHRNVDETTNPYLPGTRRAHYWREGWWEACFNTDNVSEVYQQYYKKVEVERLAS